MTLLITGAAGAIGARLAADLATHGIPLRLLDQRPPDAGPPARAEFVQADLRDLDAIEKAAAGISAAVHLAGITQEGPFTDMVEHNITGTHHVLEAARRQRVPRVVLASSHHVTDLNPVDAPTAPLAPTASTPYPRSPPKPWATSTLTRPTCRSSPSASAATATAPPSPPPGDLAQPPRRHRTAPLSRHPAPDRPVPHPVPGTSANRESWWPPTDWEALGYQPADGADQHPGSGPLADRFMGGAFADDELPT